MKPLRLSRVEIIAQNSVQEIGLRNFELVGFPLDEFLVIVRDNEQLVFVGKCPRAYVAVQRTPPAGVALDVVALLTERLPVAKIIRAVPGARDFVIWAEFHVRFLQSTGSALVPVLLLDLFPISLAQLRPRLALLAYVQALQLVTGAFLSDRSEAFLALQFPHTAENVLVRLAASFGSKGINRRADFILGQYGTRDAMTRWPKRPQNHRVIAFVRWGRINKTSFRLSKPLLPSRLRFVRRGPGSDEKALAGAGFGHFGARL